MPVSEVVLWVQLANLVLTISGLVWGWLTMRSKANSAAIQSLIDGLAGEARRIDRIETRLDDAPDHEDLKLIYNRLNALAESHSKQAGTLEAMSLNLQLIHRHLLKDAN